MHLMESECCWTQLSRESDLQSWVGVRVLKSEETLKSMYWSAVHCSAEHLPARRRIRVNRQ